MIDMENKPYDIAFSFAGEDREFVESVALSLLRRGVRVFYDEFERGNLLGEDLAVYLDTIYRKSAHYVAVFVSTAYRDKPWTKHEFRSSLAGQVFGRADYLLPVFLEPLDLHGLAPTVGRLDVGDDSPEAVGAVLFSKLSSSGVMNRVEAIVHSESLCIVREGGDSHIPRKVVGKMGRNETDFFTTTNGLYVVVGFDSYARNIWIYDPIAETDSSFMILVADDASHPQNVTALVAEMATWDTASLPFRAEQVIVTKTSSEGDRSGHFTRWEHPTRRLTVEYHERYPYRKRDYDGERYYVVEDEALGARASVEHSVIRAQKIAIAADGKGFGAIVVAESFRGDSEEPSYCTLDLALFGVRAVRSA